MSPPQRKFAFTLFISENEYDSFKTKLAEMFDDQEANMKFLVFQLERTSTGRTHVQGFVRFKSPHRFPWVKRLLGNEVHLENARGTDQENIDYCTKEDSRVAVGLQLGECSAPGARSDLAHAAAAVVSGTPIGELALENPAMYVRYHRGLRELRRVLRPAAASSFRTLEVKVFWGVPGYGKTRMAFEASGGYDQAYVLEYKGGNRPLYFDGYDRENCLIIDDFYSWIPYAMLLRILDGHPYKVDQRGSWEWACWTKVFLTSNTNPDTWYPTISDKSALKRRISQVVHFEELRNEVTG